MPSCEIGSWCRARFQGKGYVTEATGGIADYAVREMGARRVTILCDAANEKSVAVARRVGFREESRIRNARRHHLSGELRDTLVFARVLPDPRSSRRG